ncbi:MAG TPA: TetR/AcrR family transcriptional regulator [Candidatus Onthovicinus excrementipullorum]|nr:TetR/AcrR family transcriptional regulator [Candidatus Onthovicinus excrementipullorum]
MAGEENTLERIRQAGKKEFMRKGFQAASLREIAKEAGVTTGAFYGYFKSKEELFNSLVEEPANVLMERYNQAQDQFANLPPEEQRGHVGDISGDCMDWMVGYVYEHLDAFQLILCHSDGTRYEHFIHEMVQIEIEATHRFVGVLSGLGHAVRRLDPQLEHILVSGMFSAFFEMVIHDMPRERAVEYTKELREFYTAGWMKIMGL